MNESNEMPEATPRPDKLENYRRLVELQGQIVDQARRNDEAARSCQVLRAHLAQQTSGRSPGRIRQALLGWLQRIQTWKTSGFRTRIDGDNAPADLTREQPY